MKEKHILIVLLWLKDCRYQHMYSFNCGEHVSSIKNLFEDEENAWFPWEKIERVLIWRVFCGMIVDMKYDKERKKVDVTTLTQDKVDCYKCLESSIYAVNKIFKMSEKAYEDIFYQNEMFNNLGEAYKNLMGAK